MESVLFDRIRKDIMNHDIVLYLKGTKAFPMCGFSAAAVQILSQLHLTFKCINVLEDNEIHKAVKEFSDWPSVPQLYIKGEFIGGTDIMRDMYSSGELQTLLTEKGFRIPDTHEAA